VRFWAWIIPQIQMEIRTSSVFTKKKVVRI
jgi:hypothetical protein